MPQDLLCERGGGVFFFPILTPPGLEEGVNGGGWLEESSWSHFAQSVLSEGSSQLSVCSAWIAIHVPWVGVQQCVCGHLLWVPLHWLQGGALQLTSHCPSLSLLA